MIVTTDVIRMKPSSSTGYGIKVMITYTSFNKEEIDLIEKEVVKVANTVMEVNTDEIQ